MWHNLFVDDFILGAYNIEEASKMVKDTHAILPEAGFQLPKAKAKNSQLEL